MGSNLLPLAPALLSLAACGGGSGPAEFAYPEILGGWDLATETTSGCSDPAYDGTQTFEPCSATPCEGMEFTETEVGYGYVSETGSEFGTIVPYTIDDTTIEFLDFRFTYTVTSSALTLTDAEPDENGCTVVSVYDARPD